MFGEATVLRALAAAAAATAVVGAVVMRHWDVQAGRQVADLTRARASDEWRFEERVAELESDLEESRELRAKLEQRLRAKRAELAGLRNEHASLLRRYATAETERASALEGRRRLELEAAPTPALPAARTAPDTRPEDPEERSEERSGTDVAKGDTDAPAVFSPEGSRLFLRASTALARLDAEGADDAEVVVETEDVGHTEDAEDAEDAKFDADGDTDGVDGVDAVDGAGSSADVADADEDGGDGDGGGGGGPEADAAAGPGQEDEVPGPPSGDGGHERAPAASEPVQPNQPTRRASGHFTVPTAVAVVPAAAPARRPATEGGFDFFGNKKPDVPGTGTDAGALATVQNEDLADVVGQEALALHKAEAESGFKPADEDARGVGQVIDLTAHDETEQIDLEGLRSAVS